jgi:hypothetical protein
MSFPRDRWYTRAFVAGVNVVARLLRWEHRSYVYAPAAIVAAAQRRGFRPALEYHGMIWQVAALERV